MYGLDFILPPLLEGGGRGVEGPVQSNHCEGTRTQVRLTAATLHLKRFVSRQIIAGGGAECVSDGAFAATYITACAVTTAQIAAAFRFCKAL
jgi:hypothetical protein